LLLALHHAAHFDDQLRTSLCIVAISCTVLKLSLNGDEIHHFMFTDSVLLRTTYYVRDSQTKNKIQGGKEDEEDDDDDVDEES
jgi:hypothetical protein